MRKYIDALNEISPNLSRNDWVKTAMAAKSEGIDFNAWNDWSSHGETYNVRDAKAVWDSSKANGGITGGTLLFMAGYEPKNSKNSRIQGAKNDYLQAGNAIPLDAVKKPSIEVMQRFASYPDAKDTHAYIAKKQGWADELKVVPNDSKEMIRGVSLAGALVIPCRDGEIINTLQYITQNEKLNLAGASFGDGYFMQGADTQKIYVTEGIGQLWAAIEATGYSAVSTFGVGRTKKVLSKLKQLYATSEIIICADCGQERTIEKIAIDENVKTVFMPDGWAENSDINDLMIKEGIPALKQLLNKPITPTDNEANNFNLDSFVLNGKSQEMREKMLEDKYVAGKLAILGQITFWYSRPNCGKTLLIIWLLIDAIKRGEIKAEDIYHVNADDNHKGLTYKLEIAEQWGFKSISPGYNGFKAEMLPNYIDAMISSGTARGKILILDTVKKFADIMDKKRGSRFGEVVRQFSLHGGTVIGLAHVNKNTDDEGNVIYAGTTDLVDDCDCAYTLETVTDDQTSGIRTVKFTNIKNRGDVALEALYEYDYSEKLSYIARLNTVKSLSDEEKQEAINRKAREAALERNYDAIQVIKNLIKSGTTNKTDIIKASLAEGITKAKAAMALKEHEGKSVEKHQYWQVSIQANNAHVYKLNIYA